MTHTTIHTIDETLRIGGTILLTTCQTLKWLRVALALLLAAPHSPMTTTSEVTQNHRILEQTTMALHTTPPTVLAPRCPTRGAQILGYTVDEIQSLLRLHTTAMKSVLASEKAAQGSCLQLLARRLVLRLA